MTGPSRRARLLAVVTVALLAAGSAPAAEGKRLPPASYGRTVDKGFVVEAVPAARMDPRLLRQRVAYGAGEPPGTIVVDSTNRFLYLVEKGGTAIRYGISVGEAGASWSGEAAIGAKRSWPRWTPPDEMIQRSPEVARHAGGLAGGPSNPLGARALYLHQDGRDTLFRLHGTGEWWSIGHGATSGCIRLMNQDIIDLFDRVPLRARVIVRPHRPIDLIVKTR
ncbi:L,D-transpeptidase [Aureimonas glaciei]|uniref:L,D-TPase catalytic domain-containing protein n=1 Tax=Aureimonas glaciei TaxID=1776957 RepID=A0A916Y646_9HYPH|nr:L,D-transpeptidase [Aureimonas glaciei]GGD31968.1 hypothetical protein GCM10011335_38780 [Aureimonas glaciei]